MKIQIDTKNKTISFDESINLFNKLLNINGTINNKFVIEKEKYINSWKAYPTVPNQLWNVYYGTSSEILDNNVKTTNKAINAYNYYNK